MYTKVQEQGKLVRLEVEKFEIVIQKLVVACCILITLAVINTQPHPVLYGVLLLVIVLGYLNKKTLARKKKGYKKELAIWEKSYTKYIKTLPSTTVGVTSGMIDSKEDLLVVESSDCQSIYIYGGVSELQKLGLNTNDWKSTRIVLKKFNKPVYNHCWGMQLNEGWHIYKEGDL